MRRLFRQFSFPGGIPSHVAPETPGSIHEGGELGLLAVPRVRRRLRQPGPRRGRHRRRRRGGDRSAGDQLALHQVRRPAPGRGGAADPAPQRLQDRQPDGARPDPRGRARRRCCAATATRRTSSQGSDPAEMHQAFAATLDHCLDEIREIQHEARTARRRPAARRPWPMIVLRSPKGWTGPKEVDGHRGRGLLALAPGAVRRRARRRRRTARMLEAWMRSYRPEELFDDDGAPVRDDRRPAPGRGPPDERQPARQRRACCCATCGCPTSATTPSRSTPPAPARSSPTRVLGHVPARRDGRATWTTFRMFSPGREQLQPAAGRPGGHRPHLERRDPAGRRPPGRRTGG